MLLADTEEYIRDEMLNIFDKIKRSYGRYTEEPTTLTTMIRWLLGGFFTHSWIISMFQNLDEESIKELIEQGLFEDDWDKSYWIQINIMFLDLITEVLVGLVERGEAEPSTIVREIRRFKEVLSAITEGE